MMTSRYRILFLKIAIFLVKFYDIHKILKNIKTLFNLFYAYPLNHRWIAVICNRQGCLSHIHLQ